MISLDSPQWSKLTHAYGNAADIPELLKKVYEDPSHVGDSYKDEPWYSLFSSLCHQGDVYPASAASVPHLVEATITDEITSISWSLISLITEVERCRRKAPHQFLDESPEDRQYLEFYTETLLKIPRLLDKAESLHADSELRKVIRDARKVFCIGGVLPHKEGSDLGELFS